MLSSNLQYRQNVYLEFLLELQSLMTEREDLHLPLLLSHFDSKLIEEYLGFKNFIKNFVNWITFIELKDYFELIIFTYFQEYLPYLLL